MKFMKINEDESFIIKNICFKKNKYFIFNNILVFLMTFLFLFLFLIIYKTKNNKLKNLNQIKNGKNNYDLNFKYHLYEREVITEKMKKYAEWILVKNEPYFINGIIRKFKPKKCLEIGVAKGGSSIVILNALKDIKDSFLVSLDLNSYYGEYHIGENVKKYFPELIDNNKWKLYTGEQPHKFLDKLNLKFDFLFLDTVHLTPGELTFYYLHKNLIDILSV